MTSLMEPQHLNDNEFEERVITRTPIRRIGEPSDVSPLVAFLAYLVLHMSLDKLSVLMVASQ
ncbi:hypothetical protein C5167_024517 [Papaver somniferum]|uniref:Uncharacterized protein n=1 Tax=Papaver somniferum TaxID=3469 RepID=A0A4Y7JNT2_PAPSO|nr:hypothetical protein C5167_024517 [Papaver somniferum]